MSHCVGKMKNIIVDLKGMVYIGAKVAHRGTCSLTR